MPHVLLIEDDERLGQQIQNTLSRSGFEVTWWTEGRVPEPEGIDLLVVDLMLPGMYGMDILVALRAQSDLPVLVLSARTDTADKIRALELGADDYVTKPFWPEELVQRVKARLRRPFLARSHTVLVGAVEIDLETREVTRAGEQLDLTPTEATILATLARRRGEPVTRAALVDALSDDQPLGAERNLDVHVSRLRKKLGEATVVETVWGVGYRLGAEPKP